MERETRPQVRNTALLVVISAPSGAGKTTLCEGLLRARPEMTRAITCTTREPRQGEKDGVDYYFLDATTFLRRVQAGNFLEHATVYGNSYGTLKNEVLLKLREGKDVLLNIDVQGAGAIRQRAEEDSELRQALVSVFMAPPSMAVLERRLRNRATDAPSVVDKRLGVAKREMSHWRQFDYLLISASVEEDIRRMMAIVDTEKMRTNRATPPEL